MTRLNDNSNATLDLTLSWQSPEGMHEERYLLRNANPWRDVYPSGFKEAIVGLCPGESVEFSYAPGEVIPDWDERLIVTLPRRDFTPPPVLGRKIAPKDGRFYPLGFFSGLPGVFPQNVRPARVIEDSDNRLVIDCNHPMAGRALRLRATVVDVRPKPGDTGGGLAHLMERLCDFGPGMQVGRRDGRPTLFGGDGTFARQDDSPDGLFYAAPRMINHVDMQASAHLGEIYAGHLAPSARVLDLMSSRDSHLPLDFPSQVVGLGLNGEEMAANPRLADHVVHDLNADPVLPFGQQEFDAVLISLSIEYLTNPEAVMAECARVLKPGGRLVIGFSDRYFPTKTIALWAELHEFERLGFVSQLIAGTRLFTGLTTHSVRNWWRPADDLHFPKLLASDPIFVAVGTRSE